MRKPIKHATTIASVACPLAEDHELVEWPDALTSASASEPEGQPQRRRSHARTPRLPTVACPLAGRPDVSVSLRVSVRQPQALALARYELPVSGVSA